MADRSNRADVRNPMLKLDSVKALAELSPEARAAVTAAFRAISDDARQRANKCWDTHKAPMAAYWKGKAVDFRHLALALRKVDNVGGSTPNA